MHRSGMEKVCTHPNCIHGGRPQPVSNFWKETRRKDGLGHNCKDCRRAYEHSPERKAAVLTRCRSPRYRARDMLRAARKRARCTLTVGDVLKMLAETTLCPLEGIPLSPGDGKMHDNSPTLDRIDPARDYVPGNVWIVSNLANRRKQDFTLAKLRDYADKIERQLAGAEPCAA